MGKGYVLTIDAFVAIIVAIGMAAVIANMLSASNINYFGKLQLSSIGNDMLAVLQQDGTFNSYVGRPESEVNSELQEQLSLLPNNYCGNIVVKVYRAGFALEKTYSADNCEKNGEIVKVKRVFVDYNTEKFGLAELELWLK